MVLPTRSQARRRTEAARAAGVARTTKAKAAVAPTTPIGSTWRRARAAAISWSLDAAPSRQGLSPTALTATFVISGATETRKMSAGEDWGISSRLMEKWAALINGEEPPDFDYPAPPTNGQLEEMYLERASEVESWGLAQEEILAEALREDLSRIEAQAEAIEDEAAGGNQWVRAGATRRANALRDSAEDVISAHNVRKGIVGDRVRAARKEILQELKRSAEAVALEYAQAWTALYTNIADEFEQAVENGTTQMSVELIEFRLDGCDTYHAGDVGHGPVTAEE